MMDLSELSREELDEMAEAARELRTCQRVLTKTGDTVVGELLRGHGTLYEWRHYPPGDVYDAEYHAQYYYHCHPETERPDGEHGHFHTFLRPLGMPAGVAPAPLEDFEEPENQNDALSHLVGIAMDVAGQPVRLFTTNRWVTGETWYAADDVIRMLDGFVVDHARPSWPANRWITALMRLFRPQIEALLRERDETIRHWAGRHPDGYVYEDRKLEVASQIMISVDEQIAAVEMALRGIRRRRSVLPEPPRFVEP
ncbi:DUF6969 family protein [Azospirillum rugosum]|uniref:DUF6969 domain-containing protein n=1 Tax=Azospirillum rugosum TaxID=416170 RepID=A0ABS4SD10_9PROT|nr:hypothetical protein [Azospirillum rugosum]MBP2290463.1 hypothetical protein [Azospirillum rugosum]MDQ0525351.1 hypothetical protein [Azospirillum rugosum]